MEGHLFQGQSERLPRPHHQGAVKRRRDGQQAGANGTLGQFGQRLIDRRLRAGQHKLFGGIAVGHHESRIFRLKVLGHQRVVGLHGEHGPDVSLAAAIRHEASAHIGQMMQRLGLQPPGGAQGGQFAKAMPGHRLGGEAEIGKHIQRAQAHRADGRLGDIRALQIVLLARALRVVKSGMRIHVVAQAPAARGGVLAREHAVGFRQRFQHSGKLAGQIG